MLLNEFYNPSANDLKLLALIVLGDGGILKFDAIQGQESLIQSAARLQKLGIILAVDDNITLSTVGNSVVKLNGISDGNGNPTKNAYNKVNPQQT